jgi:hypothetical protein
MTIGYIVSKQIATINLLINLSHCWYCLHLDRCWKLVARSQQVLDYNSAHFIVELKLFKALYGRWRIFTNYSDAMNITNMVYL